MACVGWLVVNRAARSDVTYAFIVFYCALIFGRSLWLGEPLTIPLHRLESGALLLFTFFMISDPKTTPDSRAGRDAVRGARRVRRLVRPVPAVPDQRAAVVAGRLLDDRAAHRSRCCPAARYAWIVPRQSATSSPAAARAAGAPVKEHVMKRMIVRSARCIVDRRLVASTVAGVLRLLRREGGHEAVQQGVAGRARARRRSHRA